MIENVRVGISSTRTIDLVMQSLELTEEMTVLGSAFVLDTTNSSVGINYDAEFVEDLPTTRNFYDMMAVAPGVVQQQTNEAWKLSAFGSSTASNSWSVDGQTTTLNESGQAFWWPNPDTIEEVQVLAIGAPAEFGNMSGAAMNVVTKSGTNQFQGGFKVWYQDDSLTSESATNHGLADDGVTRVDNVPFRRDEFLDFSATLGGPIVRDKVWFFAAYEIFRDALNEVGDPSGLPAETFSDKYDLKLDWAATESLNFQAKYHRDDWPWTFSDGFRTASATGGEGDRNPAWGCQHG